MEKDSGRETVKEKLTPIILEVLQEHCPWAMIPSEEGSDDRMFSENKLYTTQELADKLGIQAKTLHNRLNAARKGKKDALLDGLSSRIVGRNRVFEGRDLNAWWESIKETL